MEKKTTTTNNKWIFMKLGGGVKRGPRKNLLNFGADPNHGADAQKTHCEISQWKNEMSLLHVCKPEVKGVP